MTQTYRVNENERKHKQDNSIFGFLMETYFGVSFFVFSSSKLVSAESPEDTVAAGVALDDEAKKRRRHKTRVWEGYTTYT